ncbi:MAG: TonB-dependent receptor [Thermodesulfobacteriota bacterium]
MILRCNERTLLRAALVTGTAAFFVLPQQVFAAEDQVVELSDVVITASRISQQVKDAPVAISIVSEQELDKIKARNPQEFLSRVPGVNSSNFGGESELTSIRIPTHFTNPYTVVLVDGVQYGSYGSGSSSQFREINLNNIARIEVIKGPASALYGSNAIGGVINVITKEPSAFPQARIWSELGDYRQWRAGVSGSGGFDKLSYFIDANHTDTEAAREHSGVDKQSGSVKLNYTATDVSLLTFKIDYVTVENDSPGSINQDDFEEDWLQSYHNFAYNKSDRVAPALSYVHYLDAAEMRAIFVLRDTEEETIPNYSIRQLTFGPFPRPYIGSYTEDDSLDMSLQLLYSHDLSLWRSKVIVGLDTEYGSKYSKTYDLSVSYDSALNKYESYTLGDLDKSYDMTTKVAAPYLQLESSPWKKLRITVGARYDSARYEVEDQLSNSIENKRGFAKTSPKAGVTYDINANLNTYVSYSKGFVVPTTSQLWTSRYDNADLDPENAENYEVGLRSSFMNRRLRLDISVYDMTITDKIVINNTPAPNTRYINAGKSSQKGIEVMTSYAPLESVQLSVAYTYARNKYESYSDQGVDYSGNWQPRSPKHHLNARLSVFPVDGVEVELEMDEVSSQFADDANLFEYTRPTLFNLRASYYWKRFTFWGHILNLTDKEHANYMSYSTSEDTMTLFPGIARTAFVGLSYRFGGDK